MYAFNSESSYNLRAFGSSRIPTSSFWT